MADEGQGHISHVPIVKCGSPAPLSIRTALLCCPGEVAAGKGDSQPPHLPQVGEASGGWYLSLTLSPHER